MIKFNLQRVMAAGVAVASTIILSGCDNNLDSMSSDVPANSAIVEDNSFVGNIDNIEFNIEDLWEVKKENFVYDPNLPAVVPINEIVLSNGEIAYIMPKDYIPYLVDKTKPMPKDAKEIEMDGYVFKYAVPITYADGGVGYLGFSGAVAIYYPYYNSLRLLQDHKSIFYKQLYDLESMYGKDSLQYQVLAYTLELEDSARELYYGNNEGMGSRS